MAAPQLSERQKRILAAIVGDYLSTAEPVGSRTICERYGIDASPATIRNDMAHLEELGFLEQPHTSAGRVPSDTGYRYYVDLILEETPLPQEQARFIERVLGAKMREVESLLKVAVGILAETSSLASIVLGPQFVPASLARVEVADAGDGRVVLILLSDAGFVETQPVDLPAIVDADSLRRMTDLINGLLQGQTWEQLSRSGVLRSLKNELPGCERMLDEAIEFLRAGLEPLASERVYISGVAHLLDLPEFQDPGRTKAVLNLLDREAALSGFLMERLGQGGVSVSIGRENRLAAMADCSLVCAPYRGADRALGGVAVLGPKRMDYGRVLSLVDFVAAHLDGLLRRLA